MMYKIALFSLFILGTLSLPSNAQTELTASVASQLSKLPLHCILSEFPNKTSHLSDAETDARLLPHELHPVFYGCLDWHSSVHGHWMLVRILKKFPNLENKEEIIQVLNNSFQTEKMEQEATYFGKYTASNIYERTYGWAWLLKLDEELYSWKDNAQAQQWHKALQPLTQKIVSLWKSYLPKLTYPNRTGVHGNTAFGLCFALDWAKTTNDTEFENAIRSKAIALYGKTHKIPAYLEPDGSDFFSPSLQIADLMTRVLPQKEFNQWFGKFYDQKSINQICGQIEVSDRNDYQTVHLDGLAFSRAWCMKDIAKILSKHQQTKTKFEQTAQRYLDHTLPLVFNGGYGGEHWLASFAVYALDR